MGKHCCDELLFKSFPLSRILWTSPIWAVEFFNGFNDVSYFIWIIEPIRLERTPGVM